MSAGKFAVGDDVALIARHGRNKSIERVGRIVWTSPGFAVVDYGHFREAWHWDDLENMMTAARERSKRKVASGD